MKTIKLFYFIVLTLFFSQGAFANTAPAPDSTSKGPYTVNSAEYRLPASIDSDILDDRVTEIWGKIFYPNDNKKNKLPLIVMLHGNHGTCGIGSHPRRDDSCEYTFSGTCPSGYVVTPNHEGYDYLANNLASWGFIVASINANRGITCGDGVEGDWGLNLARGKLVLKHLSLFYKWSRGENAPVEKNTDPQFLRDKIDFSSVGLLGHSRGGEGVRAAYNLYSDKDSQWPAKIPGLVIKAIFEIGAVDGQTSRVLDANGTVWNQLLPMCDGDVVELAGRFPFERMLLNKSEKTDAQKSLYEVWGANHNFFNTEWQENDSHGCVNGKPLFNSKDTHSEKQQKIALASVPAFFRSRLGTAEAEFNNNFNPLYALPSIVTHTTQVDRDFTPSPAQSENGVVEDFDKETGINSSGNANLSSSIQIEHIDLQKPQRAARISWQAASSQTFFEAVWDKSGRNIQDFMTLDFRVRRTENLRTDKVVDFSIALEDASGVLSAKIQVSHYAVINGPGNFNPVLKTIRIPLSAFRNVDLRHIHGVRFIFNETKKDSIYLANIRFHKQEGVGSEKNTGLHALYETEREFNQPLTMQSINSPVQFISSHLNKIISVRSVSKTLSLSGKAGVEITLKSQVPFPVLNRLPILKIGDQVFKLSRYSDPVHLTELTFTLTQEQYQRIPKHAEVIIEHDKVWQFGRFDY